MLVCLVPSSLGLLIGLRGNWDDGRILIAFAALLGALILGGVPVLRAIERGAEAIANSLSWLMLTMVGLLIMMGGATARVFGRDVLTGRRRRQQRIDGWTAVTPQGDVPTSTRPFGPTPDANRRPPGLTFIRSAAAIAFMLLVINYAIGYLWDALIDPPAAPAAVPERIGKHAGTQPVDPRVDVPAMSSAPWRTTYFNEMASVPIHYWPYLNYQPGSFQGRYINIDGWHRRTYQPSGADASAPTVHFYGGSKVWGEGQRDEYTIPSMVARLAERAGTPIRAVNLGQRGFVNFQEMLLFEQVTTIDSDRPAFAVFYDGTNDVNAQLGPVRGVPTTTNVSELAGLFQQSVDGLTTQRSAGPDDGSFGDVFRRFVNAYERRSAVHRLLGTDAAGAARALRQTDGPIFDPPSADDVPEVIEATLDVYERGRALINSIAATRGIKPVYFAERQITLATPAGASEVYFARYRQIVDALAHAGPDVIDIGSALDGHQDTYIDPGHTNEAGAAVVAQAMFEHLRPMLRAFYESNR